MFRIAIVAALLALVCMEHINAKNVIFGANHKTGTALTARTRKAIIACDPNMTSMFVPRFNDPIERRNLYIISVRNPFRMVVSGYLYHKRGPEPWTREPIPRHVHVHGHHLLRSDPRVVRPYDVETYEHYLTRLTMKDGLLAEMVRSEHTEFPHARYCAGFKNTSNVFRVCLDDMMQDAFRFHDIMVREFKFLGITESCSNQAHRALDAEGPDVYHDHGTQDALLDRNGLLNMARALDQSHFNGTITRLERLVDCSDWMMISELDHADYINDTDQ